MGDVVRASPFFVLNSLDQNMPQMRRHGFIAKTFHVHTERSSTWPVAFGCQSR